MPEAWGKFATSSVPTIYANAVKDKSYIINIRAPTVDVGYVPNAKYLAHIPHQTQFKPIYQML